MWLCGGRLWSAGYPQYGQLGHGDDHEHNTKDSAWRSLFYAPLPPLSLRRRCVAVQLLPDAAACCVSALALNFLHFDGTGARCAGLVRWTRGEVGQPRALWPKATTALTPRPAYPPVGKGPAHGNEKSHLDKLTHKMTPRRLH